MTYKASSVATSTYGSGWVDPLLMERNDLVLGNLNTDVTTAALTDSNNMFYILSNNLEYLKDLQSTGDQTFTLSAAATSGLNTIQTYVNTWPKEINHTYTISIADGATGFQTSSLTCAGFFGSGSIVLSDGRAATSIGTGATTEGLGSIAFRDCLVSEIILRHTSTSTAPLTFFATSVGSLITLDNCGNKISLRNTYFYNGDTANATSRCITVADCPNVIFTGVCTIGLGGYTTAEIYNNSKVLFTKVSQAGTASATDKDFYIRDGAVVTNRGTAGSTDQPWGVINDYGGSYLYFTTASNTWTLIHN